MFAVIFRAELGILDQDYETASSRLRELAFSKYGCLDLITASEGHEEITISYWESEEAIRSWKNDAEHLLVQEKARNKWYKSYSVQVVEVQREYKSNR